MNLSRLGRPATLPVLVLLAEDGLHELLGIAHFYVGSPLPTFAPTK